MMRRRPIFFGDQRRKVIFDLAATNEGSDDTESHVEMATQEDIRSMLG